MKQEQIKAAIEWLYGHKRGHDMCNETIDVAIAALEKQLVKRPVNVRYLMNGDIKLRYCPSCNNQFVFHPTYCDRCGQKLREE